MNNTLSFRGIDKFPIVIILLASVVRLYAPGVNSFILMVVMPMLMLWCFSKNRSLLDNNIKTYVFLLLWMILTTIVSTDIGRSLTIMKTIIGGGVISIVLYYLASTNIKNVPWLLVSYAFNFIVTMYFLYTTGAILDVDTENTRLTTDKYGINANDLAYYLFYITIGVTLIGWDGVNRLTRLRFVLYAVLVILALWLSILTASRQILYIVLPFILVSILLRQMKTVNANTILKYAIPLLIISIIVYLYYVNNMYKGSYLEYRMEQGIREDSRSVLMIKGFEVGLEHPLFGVGPNCFALFTSTRAFSHCSYSEIFACSGLLALILYVAVIIKAIKLQHRYYKITNNRVFLYLQVAIIAWGIYNFLFVFYSSPWLIAFLFLLLGYSKSYYNRIIKPKSVVRSNEFV